MKSVKSKKGNPHSAGTRRNTMSEEKLPKVESMIKHEDVTKYDEELSKLIESYNQEIEKIKDDTELSNTIFSDMGKKLIEVEKKIKDDNETPQKAKKVFAAVKLRVSQKIHKNISNVDKVFKVAKFCETETYKKYKDRLPRGWGTLYLLLSLKDDKKEIDVSKIDNLMLDAEITTDIKRSELIKKIDAIKNPNKVINKKVTITIEGGAEPTQQQLNELQKYLNRRLKKWKVTKPEITSETISSEEETNDSEDDKTETKNNEQSIPAS